MCVRRAQINRTSGRGREAILELEDFEREQLQEISHMETRLAVIRDEIIAQHRARTAPPRSHADPPTHALKGLKADADHDRDPNAENQGLL
jgi:hypothetical protein